MSSLCHTPWHTKLYYALDGMHCSCWHNESRLPQHRLRLPEGERQHPRDAAILLYLRTRRQNHPRSQEWDSRPKRTPAESYEQSRVTVSNSNHLMVSDQYGLYPFLLRCCVRWITALDFGDFSLCGYPLATTLTLERLRHDIPLFFVWTAMLLYWMFQACLIPFMIIIIKRKAFSKSWMASDKCVHSI